MPRGNPPPPAPRTVADALLTPYRHRSSPVHRLPAAVKLLGAATCVLTCVLLPRAAWLAYTAIGAALVLAAAFSAVSPWHLAKRLLLAEPVAVGIALLALLQVNGVPAFLTMLARSTLCLFCIILLTATTRFTDLLRVFRSLCVPSLLVITLALMQRYLFVLAEESRRLSRARRSRTFLAGRRRTWHLAAGVAAQLFIRSSERAERVYAAMCARGWRL